MDESATDPFAARRKRTGRLLVLSAAVLWSLSGVVTKSLALDGQTIAFYRGFFAGATLLPFVPKSNRRFHPAMVPLILAFGAMTGFFLSAIQATTAANAIVLQYTSSFWTIPLGWLILRERPDRRAVLGIMIGMVGILAVVLGGHSGNAREVRGLAMSLASGLAYAGVIVGLRGLRRYDSAWLSAVNNLGGSAVLGVWIAATETTGIRLPSGREAVVLALFGIVQMALPYLLFARGLREIVAGEAGLITLIEPVLNPVWVAWKTHEKPAPATCAGGALLLFGLAFRYAADVVPHRRKSPPSA